MNQTCLLSRDTISFQECPAFWRHVPLNVSRMWISMKRETRLPPLPLVFFSSQGSHQLLNIWLKKRPFFTGWWFAIDASATYYVDTRDVFHLCGVFATISMFMVNAVSNSLLRGEGFTDGCLGPVGARIWFFFGFMMGFGSLLGWFAPYHNISIIYFYKSRFCLHPVWRVCSWW